MPSMYNSGCYYCGGWHGTPYFSFTFPGRPMVIHIECLEEKLGQGELEQDDFVFVQEFAEFLHERREARKDERIQLYREAQFFVMPEPFLLKPQG